VHIQIHIGVVCVHIRWQEGGPDIADVVEGVAVAEALAGHSLKLVANKLLLARIVGVDEQV